jgi:hypothetical protein
MASRGIAHQRAVLQKRAELAKHVESIKKTRVKIATAKVQLRQLRGKQ